MPIKLFWEDPNLAELGHYIYRSTETMDVDNMPDYVYDVAANVITYTDMDVALTDSEDYWYRVGAYVTGTEKISDEYNVNASTDPIVGQSVFYLKCDSVDGTTLSDDKGLYDAELVADCEVESFGDTGLAVSLNGTDQFIGSSLFYDLAVSFLTNITVGVWFKTSTFKDQMLITADRNEYYRLAIGSLGGNYDTGALGVSVTTSNSTLTKDSTEDMCGLDNVCDGEWHLAIFTFDNGELILYQDDFQVAKMTTYGTLIGTFEDPSEQLYRYVNIGVGSEAVEQSGDASPYEFFDGLITKMFVLNRTMAQAEVVATYNQGAEL